MTTQLPTTNEQLQNVQRENEALRLEVSHLTEQNTQLSDQLEHMRKINQKLKLNLISNSQPELKDVPIARTGTRRAVTTLHDYSVVKTIERKLTPNLLVTSPTEKEGLERNEFSGTISESIKDDDSLTSPVLPTKIQQPTQHKTFPEVPKSDNVPESQNVEKLSEATQKFAEKMEQDEIQYTREILQNILDEPAKFCELNNIVKLSAHSPFSKAEISKAEKYIESTENMMRKWTKQIEEINKNCLAYTRAVQTFENQLLVDKNLLGNNIELQNLLMLVAQVLEEHATYLEVFTQIVENSVRIPLKNFYKENLRSHKDLKKRMQKSSEELETNQTKYLSTKKVALLKETTSGQALVKSYTNALRVFENARIDYIRHLNELNVQINIELVEKLCNLVTGRMVHFNSSYGTLVSLEKQFNLIKATIPKKSQIQTELNIELEGFRESMTNETAISNLYPSRPNILKEGYLFIKIDNKEAKKKYCMIPSDGILYWVKETESAGEIPETIETANLKLCSVKQRPELEQVFSFELVDAAVKKPLIIQTDSAASLNEWIDTIRTVIEKLLSNSISMDKPGIKRHSAMASLDHVPETKETKGPNSKQTLISKIIKNNVCADCGAEDPSWISLNLGVTICIQCSGIHRQLGPSISKVRSLKLDNLGIAVLRLFSKLPTKEVNGVWEGILKDGVTMKPTADSDKEVRAAWIKLKYVEKALVKTLKETDYVKNISQALQEKDLIKVLNVIACSNININAIHTIEGRNQTLLHYAASKSSLEIVEFLIRNGSDVKALDQEKLKPIDRAILSNNTEVLGLLLGSTKTMEV